MTSNATGIHSESAKSLGFKSKINMNLAGVFYSVMKDCTISGEPVYSHITQRFANPAELSILYAITRMTMHRMTI